MKIGAEMGHIVQAYAHYYNEYRPHQGLGNRPLSNRKNPSLTSNTQAGTIQRQQWLGELLKHYYRQAA